MEHFKIYLNVLLITFFSTSLVKGVGFISLTLRDRTGEKAREKCKEYAEFGKTNKNECHGNYFKSWEWDNNKNWDYTTKPREFPHMVMLGGSKDNFRCVGSLISKQFVLSVAHCPKRLMELFNGTLWARLGDNDNAPSKNSKAVTIKVAKVHIHPNFTVSRPIKDDISLLELEKEVEFDELIRPACLDTEKEVNNSTLFVSGWAIVSTQGEKAPSKLQKTPMQITKEIDDVSKEIPDSSMFLAVKNLPGMKDSCQGDSGAPLMTSMENPNCMYNIVGLNSHGKSCAKSVSMYTRVSNYIGWIEKVIWIRHYWD